MGQGRWQMLKAVKSHGVVTVVEPSALFLTRDAAFSKRVADASGLQVALATGVYTYDHLPQPLMTRDEDGLADNLRLRDRERHPRDRDQAGLPQVRRRRRRASRRTSKRCTAP